MILKSVFLFYRFLVTSSLGLKARVGCFIHIGEANIMYATPANQPSYKNCSTFANRKGGGLLQWVQTMALAYIHSN